MFHQARCVTVISLFSNQGVVLLFMAESGAHKLCLTSSMSDYISKGSQQDCNCQILCILQSHIIYFYHLCLFHFIYWCKLEVKWRCDCFCVEFDINLYIFVDEQVKLIPCFSNYEKSKCEKKIYTNRLKNL